MGKATVYADTLSRAARAIGGEARLATCLRVPVQDVQRWVRGEAYPSTEIYQRALDLLVGIGCA
jgi:hypothetical protein